VSTDMCVRGRPRVSSWGCCEMVGQAAPFVYRAELHGSRRRSDKGDVYDLLAWPSYHVLNEKRPVWSSRAFIGSVGSVCMLPNAPPQRQEHFNDGLGGLVEMARAGAETVMNSVQPLSGLSCRRPCPPSTTPSTPPATGEVLYKLKCLTNHKTRLIHVTDSKESKAREVAKRVYLVGIGMFLDYLVRTHSPNR
jgi:hypothetical protein